MFLPGSLEIAQLFLGLLSVSFSLCYLCPSHSHEGQLGLGLALEIDSRGGPSFLLVLLIVRGQIGGPIVWLAAGQIDSYFDLSSFSNSSAYRY